MTDQTRKIALVPTWNATAAIVAAALENGTDEGRRLAREELAHMASLLDRVRPLLGRCADFLAGFEDDATQPSAAALLADVSAMFNNKPDAQPTAQAARYFTAVQCVPPGGSEPSTFLYRRGAEGSKPLQGELVSPLFSSLADLYPWMDSNGYRIRQGGEPWEAERKPGAF